MQVSPPVSPTPKDEAPRHVVNHLSVRYLIMQNPEPFYDMAAVGCRSHLEGHAHCVDDVVRGMASELGGDVIEKPADPTDVRCRGWQACQVHGGHRHAEFHAA